MEAMASGIQHVVLLTEHVPVHDVMEILAEARERVAKELREKIRRSVTDDAEDILQRAERLMSTLNDHPKAGDLRQKVENLRSQMASGQTDQAEQLVFELMSMVNDLESTAT